MTYLVPDFRPASREIHVTPPFFPLQRNFDEFSAVPRPSQLFPRAFALRHGVLPNLPVHGHSIGHIDMLTMKQSHFGDALPVLADGCVVVFDADGVVERTTMKRAEVEGSFDSKCYVRCDGHTVEFSGNPARWGRPDNVFGYNFADSLRIVNAILATLGLPPFSAGDSFETLNKAGDVVRVWTGATISRIDITQNYCTGSADSATHFLRWLAGQKLKGKKTDFYGDHTTVDFGRHSRRSYFKVYSKGFELLKHSKGCADIDTLEKQQRMEIIDKLAHWCDDSGLVRAELELKSNTLRDLHCYYLGEIDMNVIQVEFKKHTSVFERATAEIDSLVELDSKVLAVYRMWQAGDNIKSKFKKSQLYKYRSLLLPHGIDIFIPSNVIRFEPKTRVIALSAAIMPDWYSLPPVSKICAA